MLNPYSLGGHLVLQHRSNNFIKTFYVIEVEKLNNYSHRFAERDNEGTFSKVGMTADKKSTVKLVQDSIQCKGGRYQVGIH